MNEGAKTGVFWTVALVMLLIAALVAWPRASDDGTENLAGQNLFDKFSNPLSAASMRVVTFDEEQGRLERFEVRRDANGLWTIPSRSGYPADAVEQMRNAANSLIGLKVLDIQTSNAEDHDDLGVIEPNLENLEIGDVGVGRLVTFKDEKQETLASLIIGDAEKDDSTKHYVRIPGQDPVYVVKLDDSPLSTDFQDWIESDLLQLSSIDIAEMEIKDYSASLGLGNRVSLTRNYAATVEMDGANWKLAELLEYDPDDPVAEPTPVDVPEETTLNKSKLNDMKNALDDLKLVSVVRKPDGMSANLRANQDFLNDKESINSLVANGFIPVPTGASGEVEILSANGEMSVTLKDGVRYIMRFGNISGFTLEDEENEESEDGEEGEERESSSGVNRFMMVTAVVDESQFPIPDLKEVPKTLEELDLLLNPPQEQAVEEVPVDDVTAEVEPAAESDDDEPSDESNADGVTKDEPTEDASPVEADQPTEDEVDTGQGDDATSDGEDAADVESADEGETESSGEGDVSGSGAAQEEAGEEGSEDEPSDGDSTDQDSTEESDDEVLTEEEKQEERLEMLEAEQEKITKDNQRKLDERNDQIEAAERRVRELNGRFADWYYVIAESTYSKLRISRDELFVEDKEEAAVPGPAFNPDAPPGQNFQVPDFGQ